MFFLTLELLVHIGCVDYPFQAARELPKYSFIMFASDSESLDECKLMKQSVDSCANDPNMQGCEVTKIYGQIICHDLAEKVDMDSILSSVDKNLKQLRIIFDNSESITYKISFSQLPVPMDVTFEGSDPESVHIQMVSDAKLLSLTATGVSMEAVEKAMTIPKLTLLSAAVKSSSSAINAGELYVDYLADLMMSSSYDVIHPDIYGVIFQITPEFYGNNDVRVIVADNEWVVNFKLPEEDDFLDEMAIHIPYNRFTKDSKPLPLTVVAVTHKFEIISENSNQNANGVINFTLYDPDYEYIKYIYSLDEESEILAENEKFDVLITSSGQWDSISSYNVYFTACQDLISLSANVNQKIKINQMNSYGYDGKIPPISGGDSGSGDDKPSGGDDVSNGDFQPIQEFNNVAYIMVQSENTPITTEMMYQQCQANPAIVSCDIVLKGNFQIAKPSTLNNCLSSIKPESDFLLIMTQEASTIDLSKIRHEVPTFIMGYGNEEYSSRGLSKAVRKLINKGKPYKKVYSDALKLSKLVKKFEMKNRMKKSIFMKSKKISESTLFTISGKSSSKATTVCFFQLNLKVIDSPLKVQNLILYFCTFDSSSEAFQATNIIVDEKSHTDLFDKSNLIKATQYGIMNGLYQYEIDFGYQIKFAQDKWEIYRFEDNSHGSTTKISEVPYSFCQKLILAVPSHYYELNTDSNSVSKIQPVNISVIDIITHLNVLNMFPSLDKVKMLADEKFTVRVTTSGNWGKLSTDISLSCFEDYIDLKSDVNENVKLQQFNFKVNDGSSQPIVTPEPTAIPIIDQTTKEHEKVGEADIKDHDFNTKVQGLFQKNIDKDKFVEVSSDDGTYEFNNLVLNDDNYFKVSDSSSVTLGSGPLNLLLDDESVDSALISVIVNEKGNVKLAFKNMQESNVEINTVTNDGNNKDDVSIVSKSEVYAPIKLKAGTNVNSLTIDSINLHAAGSVIAEKEEGKSINVKNLEIQPQTNGRVENIKITDKLSISQSASITLNNVDIDESSVFNVQLSTYNIKNYENPMITGVLGDPPGRIILQKTKSQDNDDFTAKSDNYKIFSGTFEKENGCQKWLNRLELEGTDFNFKDCIDVDSNAKSLETNVQALVVSNRTKEKNGLPKSAIIGIVVGCVVVVAIIVIVVVVVVIKKRKKNEDSSEKEQEVDL